MNEKLRNCGNREFRDYSNSCIPKVHLAFLPLPHALCPNTKNSVPHPHEKRYSPKIVWRRISNGEHRASESEFAMTNSPTRFD